MNATIARITLVSVCLAGTFATADAQLARSLAVLTVPVPDLPAGCALKPDDPKPVVTQGRVMIARPAVGSVPPTNPWSGSDRQLAASIRARIDAMPGRPPDVIQLDAAAARAWQLKWADNVLEAYQAAYRTSDESLIDVFAVRFNDAALAREGPVAGTQPPPRGMVSRVILGPSVALVSARVDSDCFKAVDRHIRSLR